MTELLVLIPDDVTYEARSVSEQEMSLDLPNGYLVRVSRQHTRPRWTVRYKPADDSFGGSKMPKSLVRATSGRSSNLTAVQAADLLKRIGTFPNPPQVMENARNGRRLTAKA